MIADELFSNFGVRVSHIGMRVAQMLQRDVWL